MANIFPKWSNTAPIKIVICLCLAVGTVVAGVTYYATPKYLRVGYQPIQPVSFEHSLHVDQLGLDCRYCHTFVDRSEHSNVPAASTCMNCHSLIKTDSPKLAPIRNSYESGEPVPWVKIHRTPDYVYFNHSVHINRGVSCVHCHGQINEMEEVYHAKPLSMSFCLECHRNPENFIRPVDEVTNLNFRYDSREEQIEQGTKFVHDWKVNPPQSCSGCHR
ncbi:cytochrome c3 family protein [Cerasicoccus frondis]|uniref:cytochrome c3 family protein n=1 Tax=Cerasicoccus frondis TaxID=490090 RepID=UPI002852B505|nr:cytochrome c3 family protein [Cerasicoccus frondis]